MKIKLLAGLATVFLIFGLVGLANATSYSIIDLGSLGGSFTYASSINDAGFVTGFSETSSGSRHAFIWDPANGMDDLGLFGGTSAFGNDINNGNKLAVTTQDKTYYYNSSDGSRVNIGNLGENYTFATGINNSGQIVGGSKTSTGGHAYIWDSANGMQDLGTLGGSGSHSYGINDLSQVVGQSSTGYDESHAFVWDGVNGMQDLGTLGGAHSQAIGINNQVQVVGSAYLDATMYHSFLWDEVNGMADLGALLTNRPSIAYSINENGLIVGTSYLLPTGGMGEAYVWQDSVGMLSLNTLINPQSGWNLTQAFDINNSGQIVGYGLINNEWRGYILTPEPVPEPTTMLLLGTGLVGVAGAARRRKKKNQA